MTNLSNLKNEIKLDSIKTFFAVTIIAILGWGVSSSAIDDIKSATINFNAMGIVSEISDKSMTIKDAKGSNSASDTTYDLNLDYLSKIETSSYTPLNLSDVKVGNRIIVQGLTNNSTFFIKRIISFDSIATPVEEKDDTVLATTTIDDVVIATTTDVGTSTLTEDVIKESTGGSSSDTTPVTPAPAPVDTVIVSTTTEPVATTTSTSTDPVATTTSDVATTTEGIIDTITSTIGDVIDKVVDVVQDVVETVVGSSTPEVVTEPVVNVQELIDNTAPILDQQQ
jgi:hypothetical protein